MIGNVSSFVQTLDQTSKTTRFGHIEIRERVIDMGSRTVAIANITTISLLTNSRYLPRLLIRLAGGALIAASFLTQNQYSGYDPTGAVAGAVVILISFLIKDLSSLVIVSNDGGRTVFESKDIKGLAEIKKFLADKINRGDVAGARAFVINQNKVENKFDKLVMGDDNSTSVSGSNNNVAANSPGAKVGSTETSFSATNSPGAVVGSGNTVHGNTVNVTQIDYASVLPTIEEWQRFYSQRDDTRHIAERLSELELLMRSGSPTAEGKGRVRSLAGELSQILQGYPPAVQLFESVMRLVGM